MKTKKFFVRGFARPNEALASFFGPLERELMGVVWANAEVSVREVADALDGRVAYTTVMTTLDRLFKKGLLDRRKVGKAFVYKAKFTAEELESGVAEDVIGGWLDAGTRGAEPVLACIVDAVSDHDRELLDRLEEMIHEKRRSLDAEK